MNLFQILALSTLAALTAPAAELRIGIIGCDTSHVTAFTEVLNNPQAKQHIPGGKVVAAFKGGSPDVPESSSRVEMYAKTLSEKYGVRFYDSIPEMCRDVDAVLLESVDGRPHLEQFKQILAAQTPEPPERGATLLTSTTRPAGSRKPVFIDKPMAGSLADVREIFRLAKAAGVPVFSSSALRYGSNTQALTQRAGKFTLVETYGPCELERHHPDLFWYGVHGVEALFTILGPDCQSVQRGTTAEGKIEVVGTWSGGRTGIFREDKTFHGMARDESGDVPAGSFDGYVPLLAQIMQFFQTGVIPVKPEETIEIFAFMEAADESKASGGKLVKLKR